MRVEHKIGRLREILADIGPCVVAFSGGVDSTFLAAAARGVLGDKVSAATILFPFVPAAERDAAARLAGAIGIRHAFIRCALPARLRDNPVDRCYHCKKMVFRSLWKLARARGVSAVIEASNADDLADFRPGGRAVKEAGARSPLLEAGFSKREIRFCSRKMELETWDKPALACLGSRFPYGEKFTSAKLAMVEKAEIYLRAIGMRQVRVRYHHGGLARIEACAGDFGLLSRRRREISGALRGLGFAYVAADMEGYRQGSMNEVIRWKKRKY